MDWTDRNCGFTLRPCPLLPESSSWTCHCAARGATCSVCLTGSPSAWRTWPSWAPGPASSEAACSWALRRSPASECGGQEWDPCGVLLGMCAGRACVNPSSARGWKVGADRVGGQRSNLPPRLGFSLEVSQERTEGSPMGQESPGDCEVGGLVRGSLKEPWGRSLCDKLNLPVSPSLLTLSTSPKPAGLNWR